ncbi:hypothetical protein [Sanguibacter inulinus]|uniref:Uncharacterized protein n=1 Tax=Sanguibacter inulinus TaxID=60922 RepID=A0A853EZF7_9MICO|nr:hypothetical protein [Sanguibacter inulinus]MBF0724089.1 hypothetical protein [Sanguibacter inulinus]NYS95234.1 hypothetical protein [Sanguibacter inulinus]
MREVRVDIGEQVVVPVLGMPRAAWSAFRDVHDMTDEDDYAVALLAACCGWTDDEAREAWDEWPADAALDLLIACVEESAPIDPTWATRRIKADPYLQVELAVCAEQGIALSDFHARSERDQDLAIAHHILSLDHCPGCGAPTEAMKNPALVKLTSRECLVCRQKHAAHTSMATEQAPYTHLSVVMAPQETHA